VSHTAKREAVYNDDHARWDDNWYALLAELHVKEQQKKKKWLGEDENWLAEFEKLALLELRK
jgi:hypothetical protein